MAITACFSLVDKEKIGIDVSAVDNNTKNSENSVTLKAEIRSKT